MSNTLATVTKNLQGFGVSQSGCASSCNNTRMICLTVGNKNYLMEVDSCGNQVADTKPLGTCSVRPDGTSFPLDENGNQVIDINEIDMDINSVIQNGSVITFTAEDGTTVSVDVCAIVAANCNSPMIVNPDGSVTYTDNAGVVSTIPAPVPETVTTLVVNADGSLTYTSEDGTVTNVAAPTVSSLAQAGSVITHTNGDGTAVSFDVCAIVAANCNSPMVVNADGSVTYTDNAGNLTTIPAPTFSSLVVNPDGSLTHTSGDGSVTNVAAPTVSTLAQAGSVITHTNGDGVAVSFDVCAIVAANCNSPMTLNADGSVTYVDNAGTLTTIPAPTFSSLVVNPDGSLTHTSGNGEVTNVPAPTVSALAVAGSVVTHTAGDGTAVNFDICAIVAANCNSPMVLNPDGSVTYTDNAGATTVIPAPTNSSLVADVAAGTFTHTSGDGVSTVVDICALAQGCAPSLVPGPGPNEYTFDNGYGVTQVINVNEIDMDINAMTVTGSVLNWTAEDGTSGNVDICAIVAANCNSPMVLNADGSVSYTDNAGNTTVIPAPTVSTLVANPDGSYTHTSGDGTVQNIAAPVVSQLVEAAGVVTHTAGDGTAVTFDICAIVAANCNSPMVLNADGSVTYTDNSGVITTIPAPPAVTNVDQADGTTLISDPANDACLVPTSLPVKWDGTDFAKGDLIKQRFESDTPDLSQYGEFIKFADSGDDCSPSPPTECIDIPRVTINPEGRPYCWDGAAWTPLGSTPGMIFEAFEVSAPTWSPVTTGVAEATIEPILAETTFTINNPCCEPVCVHIDLTHHAEIGVEKSVGVLVDALVSFDGGGNLTFGHHNYAWFDLGNWFRAESWTGRCYKRTIEPNSSLEITVSMIARWFGEGTIEPTNAIKTKAAFPAIYGCVVGGVEKQ